MFCTIVYHEKMYWLLASPWLPARVFLELNYANFSQDQNQDCRTFAPLLCSQNFTNKQNCG
jgi:hypothetical protein